MKHVTWQVDIDDTFDQIQKKQTSEKLKFKPITTAKPDKAICFAHWWNRYGNGSLTNRNFKFTFYSAIAKEGGRKWTVYGLSEPVNFETDRQMICESFELKKTRTSEELLMDHSLSRPPTLKSHWKVGLCSQQVHCSVQKPLYTNFEANCKTQVDCERMVNHCKKMYPVKQLTIGYQR